MTRNEHKNSFSGKGVFPPKYAFTLLIPIRNIFLSPNLCSHGIGKPSLRHETGVLEGIKGCYLRLLEKKAFHLKSFATKVFRHLKQTTSKPDFMPMVGTAAGILRAAPTLIRTDGAVVPYSWTPLSVTA